MTFTNPRYGDAAGTCILAEWDGATVTIPADPGNRDYRLLTEGDAEVGLAPATIAPFQRWPDLAAAQAEFIAEADAEATRRRVAAVGTADATKLAMYEQKYQTAIAAVGGDSAALAALSDEAAARGVTAGDLAALIKATGDAWRALGQAIEAASAAHKVAIAGLGDVAAAEAYDTGAGWLE